METASNKMSSIYKGVKESAVTSKFVTTENTFQCPAVFQVIGHNLKSQK